MYVGTPFDPIEAGEVDNFAFDFTQQAGSAVITSTAWSCSLSRYLPEASDPSSQSRILDFSAQRLLQVRTGPDPGQLFPLQGAFSVASIGGMPMSAVGGLYFLEARVTLSDGRTLALNSTVRCVRPGSR